ncbi:CoA transferase [Antricoccus suffuscus]|uniref:CoA transferase n=1 Tax=Antricoccus suffuscus TaxID=1629062 RepID=UPI00147597EB|nr:CoA transferase [Antricoccus suffuscus]
MSPNTQSPLSGVVVLDTSESIAGQYAGRLLAMHGADVLLMEPPGGTRTRTMTPRTSDADSYLFRHLNQGKRSVALDPSTDRELLRGLVKRADVILRGPDSPPMGSVPDSAIDCEVRDFPTSGPYRDWQGSELIHYALSGTMNATGDITRKPIYGVGRRSSYATGTSAYITVVSALWERRSSGRGQHVEATVFESLAAMGQNLISQYSYNGTAETRAKYPGFLAMLQCKDAWVIMFAIRGWPTMCRVFGLEELIDDPRFLTSGDRLANWEAAVEMFRGPASTMLADDVVAQAQAGRVSAERVSSLSDLVGSQQWSARSMLRTVPSTDGQREEVAMSRIFTNSSADTEVRFASPCYGDDVVFAQSIAGESK